MLDNVGSRLSWEHIRFCHQRSVDKCQSSVWNQLALIFSTVGQLKSTKDGGWSSVTRVLSRSHFDNNWVVALLFNNLIDLIGLIDQVQLLLWWGLWRRTVSSGEGNCMQGGIEILDSVCPHLPTCTCLSACTCPPLLTPQLQLLATDYLQVYFFIIC